MTAPEPQTPARTLRAVLPSPSTFSTALLAAAALGLGALGCAAEPAGPFAEPMVLAGTEVATAQLNQGWEDYMTYCFQCHGEAGKGEGHAGVGLQVPPRDFTSAQFKFAAVEQGELPTDDELLRVIRHGFDGTAMYDWNLSDERLMNIIQYIKTFAPDDWEPDAEPGELVEFGENPFGQERRQEAIDFGSKVYHGYARCYQCHPAYLPTEDIRAATKELIGLDQPVSLRENWHRTELKDSSYGAKALPPDFTWHRLRTINDTMGREEQVRQLYLIVAAGINGAAMPAWKQSMPEEYMWAMAYYIQSLSELRDTPERLAFWEQTVGIDPADDQPAVVVSEAS